MKIDNAKQKNFITLESTPTIIHSIIFQLNICLAIN
jgi:hypothetical protein